MSKKNVFSIASTKDETSLLNFIQEAATIGTWQVDLDTMLTYWSDVTKHIHQVPNDFQPTVETGISFYKEGFSRNKIKTVFDRCVKHAENFDLELQIVTAKGQEKWVRAIGMPILKNGVVHKVYGAFQDIDEKTRTAKKVSSSEEQFRKTFEFALVGMGLLDLTGTWININTSLRKTLGYSFEEMKTLTLQDISYPEDKDSLINAMRNIVENRISNYQTETRYLNKFGQTIWALLSLSLVRNNINEPLHFVAQIQDITSQKDATEKLKQLLKTSEDQNKRLLNFTHIVSHNMRSHYSNLKMLSNIIEIDTPETTQNQEFSLMKDAIENLGETIENLNKVIVVNKTKEEDFEAVNLRSMVEKVITNINALITTNQAITRINIDKNLNVLVVAAYLESIILNLLTNAIKYKSPDRPLEISISAKLKKNKAIIEFKDNGLGVDLCLHGKKLFGMYKTFHDHEEARGLGLFLTKNQIKAMGGKITIKSKVDVGTSFLIHLKHETN
ncbi:sensor histidine kinase [uncultured Winogradskyella sp.]|uniref:sensor histidine kinase n=1 Tax=uncultured Winogradskyella sp. TaxID=395353 RepID=UPI002605B3AE|nr:sensor histidine kinase [uncultured Winogradskyella sp.]